MEDNEKHRSRMKYEIKCNFKCITRTQNREVGVTKTKLSMALFKED